MSHLGRKSYTLGITMLRWTFVATRYYAIIYHDSFMAKSYVTIGTVSQRGFQLIIEILYIFFLSYFD